MLQGPPHIWSRILTNSIITLAYNTSSHSTTDSLSVFYDTQPGGIYSNYAVERNGNLQKILETQKLILAEMDCYELCTFNGPNISRKI
jgi:hypothetical protein